MATHLLASFGTRNRPPHSTPMSADDDQSKRNVFLRKWKRAVSRGPSGGLQCWRREAKSLGCQQFIWSCITIRLTDVLTETRGQNYILRQLNAVHVFIPHFPHQHSGIISPSLSAHFASGIFRHTFCNFTFFYVSSVPRCLYSRM